MAIIANKNGQNLYTVGDSLGNSFLIEAISLENLTVDISNGFKKYRLFLSNVKNKL